MSLLLSDAFFTMELSTVIDSWLDVPVEQVTAPALDAGKFLLQFTEQEEGDPFPSLEGLTGSYAHIPQVDQTFVDELRYCANVSHTWCGWFFLTCAFRST